MNLDPQGTATKNVSMGGQYHIAGLPDPTLEHEAVNLRTLNKEIRANNLLESLKYLRLDGENLSSNERSQTCRSGRCDSAY